MMKTNTHVKLAAVLVAFAGTGAALAQSKAAKEDKKIQGRLDQPLERAGQGAARSTTILSSNINGEAYKVEIRDGETTATINGKEVPADRVRRTDDTIEVLDADGGVLASFNVPRAQQAWRAADAGAARVYRFSGTPGQGMGGGWAQPPVAEKLELPTVMIGIRMTDDTGEVVVDEAVEGLPAEKAGVMVGDVILSIGGHEIKKVTDVRDAVKGHEVGDKLEFKLRRDDTERTLTIRLMAYDAVKLPMMEPQVKLENFGGFTPGHHGQWREEVRTHIEQALSQLKNNEALNSERLKANIEKAMNEALAALDKAKDETSLWLRNFNAPEGQGKARTFVYGGNNPDHVFAVPGQADSTKQLEKVSDQLDQLSRRLDEIQKRLDKLDDKR